jgi:hypothetical protein
MAHNGLLDWCLALALGATVFEATRRYTRRSQSDWALRVDADEDTLTWVADLLSAEEL